MNTSILFKSVDDLAKLPGRRNPAVRDVLVLIPEPSTDTRRTPGHAVLEDNLLQLSLRKEALWAGHNLK